MKKTASHQLDGNRFDRVGAADLDPACLVYEDCRFTRCNFGNANLSGVTFRECLFEDCDLSLVALRDSSLQDVRFLRSKMLGVSFNDCRKFLFNVGFGQCMLRLGSFTRLDLRDTAFEGCDLQEADFTGANLSGARFGNCDLQRATFFHTNLERADFRSAYGYSIPPESNRLNKARFSLPEVLGLLDAYGIIIE